MEMTTPFWDDVSSPGPSLPFLAGDVHAEVAVVGLGGSGLTAIGELLARGVEVVGVDAGVVGNGAAGRNGGFLLAGLADFHHVAIGKFGRERADECYRATLSELDRIFELTPGAATRVGSLRIAATPRELDDCEEQYEAMVASGLAVERYEGPEGKGLCFASDGSLQPLERCHGLARRALEDGARLFGESPVMSLERGRVSTARGSITCRSVLVCVDGSLELLVPALSGSLRSARLQMLATVPLGERIVARPVYTRYGLDYWQQCANGELLLGGCRDVGGEQEWTTEAVPSEAVQSALDTLLGSELEIAADVTHRWAGVVSFTDTGLPVVREVAQSVFVAGGYNGTGNVVGAIAAKGLVGLALDGHSRLATLFDSTGV